MGARHKLNGGYFNGALLLAGSLGWATGSATVFLVALCGLLVAGFVSHDLR